MQRRAFLKASFCCLASCFIPLNISFSAKQRKKLKLIYLAELPYKDKIRLWIPMPMNTEYQRLNDFEIESNASTVLITKDNTLGEKLDLKFTPPVITISNSISIYIHKHTS